MKEEENNGETLLRQLMSGLKAVQLSISMVVLYSLCEENKAIEEDIQKVTDSYEKFHNDLDIEIVDSPNPILIHSGKKFISELDSLRKNKEAQTDEILETISNIKDVINSLIE